MRRCLSYAIPISLVLWLGILLTMLGCAPKTDTSPGAASKPAIVAAEAGMVVAGRAILAYASLPQCQPDQTPSACWQPEVKARARAAFDHAVDVVVGAQAIADAGGTPSTVAVQSAMAALQAVVASLPQPAAPR